MYDSGQANSGCNGIRCVRLEFELFHMLLSGDAARESKGRAEGQENHPRLISFRLCLRVNVKIMKLKNFRAQV